MKIPGILFCTLLFFFVACKKDKDAPPSNPVTVPVLSVKLNPQYLNSAQIDSAFAIWNTNRQEQRIKMIVRNDSLIADAALFNEGNGNLTLHIISNKKYRNQYYAQWVTKKTLALQKTKSVNYNGPLSFSDTEWFPRVELKDGIGHVAVIALRPDDAFVWVKEPGHNMVKLVIERSYWKTVGGIQLAGSEIWECTNNCTNVENEDYFKTLPQRVGNRPWNHISIIILFQTNHNGEGAGLQLELDL